MNTLISTLTLPIVTLNMFGGIIAGIWLIVLGKWTPVLIAIASLFISSFCISFAMMPSMLLSVPGAKLLKKGNIVSGHFLLFCSSLYQYGIIWYWSIFVFGIFARYAGKQGSGIIPLLIMAYSVAMGPIGYLASKEGDSPATSITTFFSMLGCVSFMFALMFNINIAMCNLIFIGIMAIGIFNNLVMNVQLATAMKIDELQNDLHQL